MSRRRSLISAKTDFCDLFKQIAESDTLIAALAGER